MVQTLQKFNPNQQTPSWHFLLWLGLVALLMLCLTGCRPARNNAKVQIQLSTWGSAQEISTLKSQLAQFETQHPTIQVDLLHIPENYYQKLHILIAGDLAPDVIFTNSISFPIYASQNVFLDLKPLLAAQTSAQSDTISLENFYPQTLQAFTWTKQETKSQKITLLGAIPRDLSDVVVFYNKDLFKKAGLEPPNHHWNWQEFQATAEKLTLDADQNGHPEQFGVSFYATPPLFWLPFVWSAGGDLFDPSLQRFQLQEPKAVAGLQYYQALRNQWHVAPRKVESGGASMSQWFLQRKIAMMVSGRWSVPVLREQASFDWDVVSLPTGPSGVSRVGIDASGYAISAQSRHPQESFTLIQFLVSKAAITQVAQSGLIIPARRDVAESASFLSPSQKPTHSQAFIDMIPNGVPTHTPVRWNEISEELGLALEPVWDGTQEPAKAMAQLQPKIDKLLELTP